MNFFDNPFFLWGGGFFYKLTRNPNLTICVCVGGGGGGGRKCTCMSKCFKWHFYSQGEHLCKIILKTMHICRSYGPEMLIYVTFKCDLDLQPT